MLRPALLRYRVHWVYDRAHLDMCLGKGAAIGLGYVLPYSS